MYNDFIENTITEALKERVTAEVDAMIEEAVKQFRKELESRRTVFAADILNSIHVIHNHDDIMHEMNYKVIFENRNVR